MINVRVYSATLCFIMRSLLSFFFSPLQTFTHDRKNLIKTHVQEYNFVRALFYRLGKFRLRTKKLFEKFRLMLELDAIINRCDVTRLIINLIYEYYSLKCMI